MLGDEVMPTALLDRLLHHVRVLILMESHTDYKERG
jgi:hypothetical protein